MWENEIDIHEVREIRCKTTLYLGVGAIHKFEDICADLKKRGIDRVIVVASKSAYIKCGAWDVMKPAFEKSQIAYTIYNGVTPNPDNRQVDEAAAMARQFGAQAVIGVGGGSPIDAGKSVAVLLKYPQHNCKELYTYEFAPETAVPLVAINTTHGTGTEVDRFAVVSIPDLGFKPCIAQDFIYPLYAIDDPALMAKLPANQTAYVSVDAINHVTEAATTKVASPYAIMLAKETIRLVAKYLPRAMKKQDDLEARYYLAYASAIAGIAFDNGMLHLTHALEHPLSAVKPDLAHGLGLAMLLPAVLETIYPAVPQTLADIYSPIVSGLTGNGSLAEAKRLAVGVEKWLFSLGLTSKLEDEGYSTSDLERLTDLARETPSLGMLLDLAPVDANSDIVRSIYERSMHSIQYENLPVAA
ncbi:alcohol dehydrogenase, class IV [Longilinea arvoryzae]|uniref:Alcohol dehydrogenase, class IV n=1 Tax=Longilinea arvoryzae TaxID=360412 RepID=A0A0K8MY51_9CHLR|nr:iron-containing alcohol dehydrogenase [Longilinea arvoryzae]GAP15941.1 alcohol dehydrogenase, class IV [Longilinea arvoryzae]